MDEEEREISTDLQSKKEITFTGLSKAAIDTVRLYRSDPDKMNPIGAITLVGMKAAFPEKFTNEQLRNNPNLTFFNYFAWLGVEVNDAVDIVPQARAEGQQEMVENIFSWWKTALRATQAEADLTPEDSMQKKQLIEDYQREILFCEGAIRETSDADLNLEKLIKYREVVNSISIVHNATALMGHEALPTRLETINKKDLSLPALEEKYSWMVNGEPETDTEEKLSALFNFAMGVQVIDDWYDVEDDKKLGLHTIATQVVAGEPTSDKAMKKIQEIADGYFDKAETYGATKTAGIGTKQFFTVLKTLIRKFPKGGGRRERLLNGGKLILRHPPGYNKTD